MQIKALVAIGVRPAKSDGLVGEINDNLFNLFGVTDDFFRSVHALFIIADRFFDHTWVLYLRVAVLYEISAEEVRRRQVWMRDTYIRDHHVTPFTALSLSENIASSILSTPILKELYPKTLALVLETLSDKNPRLEDLTSRSARYLAREKLARGDHKGAAALYLHAASGESRAAVKLRTLGGASLSMMLQGEYRLAVDTLINVYLDNPSAPILLPFKQLVKQLPDITDWPNTIRLGILLHISNQFDREGDLSIERLAFEKFCLDNNITGPADLAARSEEFGIDCIIEYLDLVWRPEVMRQTLIYSSAEQIEEARIEACRSLAKIDVKRSRIHQEELASRIKQQEISKATRLVEQSKVYVDIDAIKRSLRARLGTSYAQYKNSLNQLEKPQDDVVHHIKTAFPNVDAATLSALLSGVHIIEGRHTQTQSELQFNALFSEIAKEFLTGDHGLNAYLSTRVRHGKFVDALRKAVMDEHLVTSKTSAGAYAENTYWLNEINNASIRDNILQCLEDFSIEFDGTLAYVRDKLIQIRQIIDLKTADKYSEGIFFYQFSTLERRLMQTYDIEFTDFDQLISKCVDTLWEKTDANLEAVRQHLNTNIRSLLILHFDKLSNNISSSCPEQTPSALFNAIARAKTATQQALDNVITWFKRSEVYDRQDFDIDFPPHIAANMVKRTMSIPNSWHGPQCTIDHVDAKLPGRALDSLVDIFYALFENAVNYAESEGINLKVRLRLKYIYGEFFGEVLSDALPPTEEQLSKLQQIRESLATQESRRLAQSEGRSGFRKIWLALDNQLFKSPSLIFDHEQDGIFRVVIAFRYSGPA